MPMVTCEEVIENFISMLS